MVSTRNTSRIHANPPRMQDQPGDVDSQPPEGTLETVQINTDEVEVLRITNQRLLRELENSPDKYNAPKRRNRPEKAKTLLPKKNNTLTLIEKQMEKEKLVTPGSVVLTNGEDCNKERHGRNNKGDGPILYQQETKERSWE